MSPNSKFLTVAVLMHFLRFLGFFWQHTKKIPKIIKKGINTARNFELCEPMCQMWWLTGKSSIQLSPKLFLYNGQICFLSGHTNMSIQKELYFIIILVEKSTLLKYLKLYCQKSKNLNWKNTRTQNTCNRRSFRIRIIGVLNKTSRGTRKPVQCS